MPRKRIAYLSPYFWPEAIGSAPYCTAVAERLAEKNDVTVIAFRPHYPNESEYLDWATGTRDRAEYRGMTISRVPCSGRGLGGFKVRIKNDLRYLAGVLRLQRNNGFGNVNTVVCYVPSVLCMLGAAAIRHRTGARVVAVVHDIESGLAGSG